MHTTRTFLLGVLTVVGASLCLPVHAAPNTLPHVPLHQTVAGNDQSDPVNHSIRKSMIQELNRRMLAMQQQYNDGLILLRRLMSDDGFYDFNIDDPVFPDFTFPFHELPKRTLTEVDKESVASDETEDKTEEETEEDKPDDIFLDSPTPGPEWNILPFLPAVPDADDLPDNYNNETHAIHVLNGTRLEVNTTTHKETGDSITTFFHTEVINILPSDRKETPVEEEEEEETTEETHVETTESPEGHTTTEESKVATVHPDLFHPNPVPAEIKDAEIWRDVDVRVGRSIPEWPMQQGKGGKNHWKREAASNPKHRGSRASSSAALRLRRSAYLKDVDSDEGKSNENTEEETENTEKQSNDNPEIPKSAETGNAETHENSGESTGNNETPENSGKAPENPSKPPPPDLRSDILVNFLPGRTEKGVPADKDAEKL